LRKEPEETVETLEEIMKQVKHLHDENQHKESSNNVNEKINLEYKWSCVSYFDEEAEMRSVK